MLSKEVVPTINENCVWRKYLKGIVIEPGLALNETGALFFEKCDGTRTIEQICELISAEYQVDIEECLHDMLELCAELEEQEILVLNQKGA